ncbi:hypothetical protein VTK73DRAFT_8233 [Phialemonium thermophilum]|uniref:Uncharacterized protein n=1 Tax=Phialemonium thermophilum TaxID=223376 RepID=A0ABR3W9I9_9PEZI
MQYQSVLASVFASTASSLASRSTAMDRRRSCSPFPRARFLVRLPGRREVVAAILGARVDARRCHRQLGLGHDLRSTPAPPHRVLDRPGGRGVPGEERRGADPGRVRGPRPGRARGPAPGRQPLGLPAPGVRREAGDPVRLPAPPVARRRGAGAGAPVRREVSGRRAQPVVRMAVRDRGRLSAADQHIRLRRLYAGHLLLSGPPPPRPGDSPCWALAGHHRRSRRSRTSRSLARQQRRHSARSVRSDIPSQHALEGRCFARLRLGAQWVCKTSCRLHSLATSRTPSSQRPELGCGGRHAGDRRRDGRRVRRRGGAHAGADRTRARGDRGPGGRRHQMLRGCGPPGQRRRRRAELLVRSHVCRPASDSVAPRGKEEDARGTASTHRRLESPICGPGLEDGRFRRESHG